MAKPIAFCYHCAIYLVLIAGRKVDLQRLTIAFALVMIIVGFVLMVQKWRQTDKREERPIVRKYGLPILSRAKRRLTQVAKTTKNDKIADEKDNAASTDDAVKPDALDSLAAAATHHQNSKHASAKIANLSDATRNRAHHAADADFQGGAPIVGGDLIYQDDAPSDLQDNSVLSSYRQVVVVNVHPRFAPISGQTVLQFAQQYALKYGDLKAFHRYEKPEGTGALWFSMLGVGANGPEAFDLPTVLQKQYMALSFFVALPNPHAVRGFDSMAQVAQAIADDLGADLYDEAGNFLDANQIQSLRALVSGYGSE